MTSRDPFGGRRPPPRPTDGIVQRPTGNLSASPTFNAPGVFVEETSSPRAIESAPTSVAGFVGAFVKGPLDLPLEVASLADFTREFGELRPDDETGHAVAQFFRNGGARACVVRVANGAAAATCDLLDASDEPALHVIAGRRIDGESVPDPGVWGDTVRIKVSAATEPGTFTLTLSQITDLSGVPTIEELEEFADLSMNASEANYCVTRVNEASQIIQLSTNGANPGIPVPVVAGLSGGENGALPDAVALSGEPQTNSGVFALRRHQDISIVALPGAVADHMTASETSLVYRAALEVCEEVGAFLIVDPARSVAAPTDAAPWIDAIGVRHRNAAVYYPRVRLAGTEAGAPSLGASGTVAGIYARTDVTRGVWKAPAGIEVSLRGVAGLAAFVDDAANGLLNPAAINALRVMPGAGPVVWGARTLVGEDGTPTDWRYVNVRRTVLFLEKSLARGLQWTVFEPNGEELWTTIRAAVSAFLESLFRQGAFQGSRSDEAFFVRCDRTTTTEIDRRNGVVNLELGVAPLRPAEFVVIKLTLGAAPP